MNKVLLTLVFSLTILISKGQSVAHSCGFDDAYDDILKSNPELVQELQINEDNLQSIIERKKKSKTTETVYTVPLVVHVIHRGEAIGVSANISDAQIASGIAQLNAAYSNTNGQGVDVKVQFQLATRDPNCNPTSGINRIDGTVLAEYATSGMERSTTKGAPEADIKALSRWPASDYYNIWIVTELDSSNYGEGGTALEYTAGFAYFPTSSNLDGTVILHGTFGNIGTAAGGTSGTLIHELGHALNLYHTFEGDGVGETCPGAGNLCGFGIGDCCGDTSPYKRTKYNCPTGTEACTGLPYDNTIKNHMDYSSDACIDRFTAEQKARIRATLEGARAGLLTSKALNSVLPNYAITAATCTGTAGSNNSSIGTANVKIIGKLDYSSGAASTSSGYADRTGQCEKLVELELDSTYTFETTIMTNSTNNQIVRAFIDYNNNGAFDLSESIFYNTNIDPEGVATQSGTFTVPGTAITSTYLRMRVLTDFQSNSTTITDACRAMAHGEIEDYIIKIKAATGAAPVAAFAANKTTVCVGEIVTLTDASTNTPTSWAWTSTGGVFSSSTAQNPTVTYATAGTYAVNLTATNATGSDPENKAGYITVVANPTVALGADKGFCAGSNTTLDAGNAGLTYLWSTAATTQSISVNAAGTYNVAVTNGTGCVGRDTIVISQNALPTVSVNSASICAGASAATFTATAPTATAYLWSGNGSGTASTTSGTTGGSYTVSVTDVNSCQNSASGTLTVNALPVVTVNNTSICSGDAAATFTATVDSSVAVYNWGGQGTGSNSTTSGSTAGNYISFVIDNNGCTGRDTGVLVVNSLPAVSVNNETICAGSPAVTFTATAATAIAYAWSGNGNGTANTTSGTNAGNYIVQVTDGNGCTALDTGLLTVNPAPVVSLGNDTTICGTISKTLDAGNTGSTYLWNNSATTKTINVTSAGTYSVTVTNAGCTGTDSIVISSGNPTVNIGNDTTYCGTGSDTLDAGNGFTSYLWNDASTNQTLIVSAAGTYHVTATDAAGCTATDSITIQVSNPVVNLRNDTTLCTPNPVTLDAGNGFASYLWSNGATTQTIAASGAGDYSVVVTDLFGCTDNDTTTITINNPTVNLGNDVTYCGTGSDTLDAGSGFTTYLWSDASTNQTLIVNSTGTYHVTATDAAGCTATDSITIQISNPVVNLRNDTTLCSPNPVTLDAGNGFASYLWSNGATTQTIAASGAGDYSVVVTDLFGCTDNDTTTITINNPTVNLGNDVTYCGTGSDTLDAGSGFTSYLWSDASTNQTLIVSTGGTYHVTATDAAGCTATDSITIQISNPVVNLRNDTTLCTPNPVTLDAGNGFASYLWSNGATSQTIAASGAGDYSVVVTDLFGCTDNDTTTITINNPTVNLGNDVTYCGTGSDTLDAGSGFTSYLWNDASTNRTLIVSAGGTYHVTATDAAGCTATDSITIQIGNPVVNLRSDTTMCTPSPILLDAGSGFATYLWSNGATSRSIIASGAGDYSVIVTDLFGCTDNDTTKIIINNPTVNLGNDATYCGTGSDTLDAGNGFTSYLWNDASTNRTLIVSSGGTYHVTATDAAGCNATDSITIQIGNPVVNLRSDTTMCTPSPILLDAGSGFATYLWSNGATSRSIIASGAGDYSVVVTDLLGCYDNDTTTITVNNPTVNLGNDATYCGTGSDTLDAGSGFTSYLWSDASTNQTLIVSTGGTYHVTATDAAGCSATDSITIQIGNPIVNLRSDTTMCTPSPILLDAGSGFATYLWSNGATSRSIIASGAGDYSVYVTDLLGCQDDDTTTITINTPVVDLGPDQTLCEGNSPILNAGNSGATYSWNTGATTQLINVSVTGQYTVTVTLGAGCEALDSVNITVNAKPTVTADPGFTTDYVETQGAVNLNFGQPLGGTYSGAGVNGTTFNTSSAGVGTHTITYHYTDISTGCYDSVDVAINVSPTTGIVEFTKENGLSVYPNPFNNEFTIISNATENSNYTITDSEGQLITTGIIIGNNEAVAQTINAELLAPGIYYLNIQNENSISVVKIIKGN